MNLPSSLESEQGLVCSFLLAPEAVGPFLAERGMRSDKLHHPGCQKVFQVAMEMWTEGKPIDIVTLTQQLRNTGFLAEVGGAAAVSSYLMVVPTAANVEAYQQAVESDYRLRKVIEACDEASKMSMEREQEPDQIVSSLSEKVLSLCSGDHKKVKTAKEMAYSALARYQDAMENKGKPRGVIPTGYTDLDSLLCGGIRPGDFILISAPTKGGKTILADNLLERVCIDGGRPGIVFSLEMMESERTDRIIASMSRASATNMRMGWLKEVELQGIAHAVTKFAGAKITIRDDLFSLAQIVGAVRQAKQRHPDLALVVVDYLQLIDEPTTKGEVRENVVARICTTLRRLATQMGTTILYLSQENDDGRSRESRRLEQDCTTWIQLADKDDHKIGKVPLNRNGPPGFFEMTYLKHCLRLENFIPEPQ